jgi:hypothetical protein
MPPIPTVWWLRPLSSAARVGEHNAVVWKRLNFRPPAARRSAFGVAHGPPNALDEPKPASSMQHDRARSAPRRRPQLLDRRKRRVRILRVIGHQPRSRQIGNRQHVSLERTPVIHGHAAWSSRFARASAGIVAERRDSCIAPIG